MLPFLLKYCTVTFLVSLYAFHQTISAVLFISVSINSLKMHRDLIINMALVWAEAAAVVKLRSPCVVV